MLEIFDELVADVFDLFWGADCKDWSPRSCPENDKLVCNFWYSWIWYSWKSDSLNRSLKNICRAIIPASLWKLPLEFLVLGCEVLSCWPWAAWAWGCGVWGLGSEYKYRSKNWAIDNWLDFAISSNSCFLLLKRSIIKVAILSAFNFSKSRSNTAFPWPSS